MGPCATNPMPAMIAGVWYQATLINGADFDFWMSRQLSRKEARTAALDFANGDYGLIYEDDDLESVRKIKR